MRTLLICFFVILTVNLTFAQTAHERSVEVSATVQEDPPQINFSWPPDPTANFYTVYRKELEAESWGEAIATLSGTDSSFVDADVEAGAAFEYAFFKKEFDLIKDTFCIEPGTELRFSIQDMYGIGLCCNFNFGFYKLEACGDIIAEGSDFDWAAEEVFTLCDDGQSCTELVITIALDIFPNSTSWTLHNNQTNEELGTSGPVGAFIDERPKYGFIYSGIKVPSIEHPGKVLLLIDDEYIDSLAFEIERLQNDLKAECWEVVTLTANKDDAVTEVKSNILDVYAAHPDLTTLFIIGHVPVPYSGDIYPDTHAENHQGAWSADTYYAELNGNWTDEFADITTAFFERNHNIPGDGKFDQDSIPTGKLELEHGRIDFYDMEAFELSEIELTRQYLNKDHLWRTGQIEVERRGLVDDNFAHQFAAPAASGWRNFAPMFGAENVHELDYFSTMSQESYLWSYGCGSGTHISANGIGTTTDFVSDSLKTVFTMLFGSQFGDWDNDNNFLKAPLASGLTLTNCWAGNPPWNFHHMAMGYHIGYSARATQNTNGIYHPGPQLVHTALMGDPTLKMHIVKPPTSFTASQLLSDIHFNVGLSTDPEVVGYYIYRKDSLNGVFEKITDEIIADPNDYFDIVGLAGTYYYMIRAVKLESSGSGTYYNLSSRLLDTLDYVVSTKETAISHLISINPNPSTGYFTIQIDQSEILNWELSVLDINGKSVFNKNYSSTSENINISHLSNGVYFINIKTNKGNHLEKLIKTSR